MDGGHRDSDRDVIIHNPTTINPLSLRIIVPVSSRNGWQMWKGDINQAFIQSHGQRNRSVFLHPPEDLGIPSTAMLKLSKPLYGLSDAGDYWCSTLRHHLTNNLTMTQSLPDPAIFLKFLEGNFEGRKRHSSRRYHPYWIRRFSQFITKNIEKFCIQAVSVIRIHFCGGRV